MVCSIALRLAYQQPKLTKYWLLAGLASLLAPHTNNDLEIGCRLLPSAVGCSVT